METFWYGLICGALVMFFLNPNDSNKGSDYAIYEQPSKISDTVFVPPILLNKNTGQTWRLYRDANSQGSVTDEGWIPVIYKFDDSKEFGDTPNIAYRNYFHSYGSSKEKYAKHYFGQDSWIDDLKYYLYENQKQ